MRHVDKKRLFVFWICCHWRLHFCRQFEEVFRLAVGVVDLDNVQLEFCVVDDDVGGVELDDVLLSRRHVDHQVLTKGSILKPDSGLGCWVEQRHIENVVELGELDSKLELVGSCREAALELSSTVRHDNF